MFNVYEINLSSCRAQNFLWALELVSLSVHTQGFGFKLFVLGPLDVLET